ncbi:MAG: hypothetical protein PHE88_10970 [Elusimicrobia bacterium]|nr:hypothetical protein [Elusimicrobiota bacterium]
MKKVNKYLNKLLIRLLISVNFLFLYFVTAIYAAPSGNIQLTIASPDPATAGEKITFQVIVLNTGAGSEKWLSGEYYLEAEIYDSNKAYIRKTDKYIGKTNIASGETFLAYIPFTVPTSYSGQYFYKITLTLKEQKIIVSEYLPFTIVELTKPPMQPSKVALGGNMILSGKYSQKTYEVYEASSNYTNSLNLNLVGKTFGSPVSLNLYALYSKDKQFELDNFLFNYYGNSVQVAFGDIQPAYNSLCLYGAGVRGLNLIGTRERFSVSVIGAESAKKQEGTSLANGIYERYLYGGKITQGLDILNAAIGGSYIISEDAKNSIKTPESTLPVRNKVVGGDGYFEFFENVSLKGEYAESQYWEDVSSGAVKDTGLKTTVSVVNVKNFSFTGIYSKIEPDFNSLGAPSSTKDKESYEISTNFSQPNICSLSVYLNNYHDNLNKDPNKTTSTQNIGSASIAFNIDKYPTLTLGYSINIAKGDPITALDNETKTPSVSLSHTIKSTTLSVSAQRSNFTDKTGVSSNLKSDMGNAGFSTRLSNNISVSAGATISETLNLISSTATTTNSYSLNMNFSNIIKEKLSAAVWGSYSTSIDKPVQSTDNTNLTGTVEFTYNLRENLATTLGFTHTDYVNNFINTESYKEESGNLRFSMSF